MRLSELVPQKRQNSLTTAKAIGILLMVVGHSGCPQYLATFIYFFHMPLFFFISGYFFNIPCSLGDARHKLARKIKGLYIPYVKWSLLFLLFHNLFWDIGIYNGSYGYHGNVFTTYTLADYLKRFFHVVYTMDKHEPLLGGFWFLKVLLLSSIIMIVISPLVKKYKRGGLTVNNSNSSYL